MFDFLKMASDPEALKAIGAIPKFIEAWTDFMQRMGKKLLRIEELCESHDHKMRAALGSLTDIEENIQILMSESSLTPELHNQVVRWSSADPRNQPLSIEEIDAAAKRQGDEWQQNLNQQMTRLIT